MREARTGDLRRAVSQASAWPAVAVLLRSPNAVCVGTLHATDWPSSIQYVLTGYLWKVSTMSIISWREWTPAFL